MLPDSEPNPVRFLRERVETAFFFHLQSPWSDHVKRKTITKRNFWCTTFPRHLAMEPHRTAYCLSRASVTSKVHQWVLMNVLRRLDLDFILLTEDTEDLIPLHWSGKIWQVSNNFQRNFQNFSVCCRLRCLRCRHGEESLCGEAASWGEDWCSQSRQPSRTRSSETRFRHVKWHVRLREIVGFIYCYIQFYSASLA